MILGAWCQQPGVGGWVLMGLFWATFVGLVLWALSRLFAPGGDDVIHRDGDEPERGSLRGSGAGHGEPAAVGRRPSSGDRQADAGPAVGPVPGGVDPVEGLRDRVDSDGHH